MYAVQIIACVTDEAAGPTYSVTRLAVALADQGLRSELMSVGREGVDSAAWQGRRVELAKGDRNGFHDRMFAPDFAGIPIVKRLSSSRAMCQAVHAAARSGAVLHSHGLWLMPNVYPGQAAARHNSPLVVAPRGMLGAPALQFSSRKKRLFWRLIQQRALAEVNCFHATSEQEAEDIRAFGLKAPVAILPNGIDVPLGADISDCTGTRTSPPPRTVLYLGRIHPKKGIDRLIRAWAEVESKQMEWRLRIVGPSEGGHCDELKALAEGFGLTRVTFEGPIYGEQKQYAYRYSDLFVLPTLHENFGMTVAEALSNGTPVISTKGAPWAGLETNRCGWWIDHGPDPMAAALHTAMSLPPEERRAMGARGRAWMERDFAWSSVARQMTEVYRWLVEGAECPGCVRVE